MKRFVFFDPSSEYNCLRIASEARAVPQGLAYVEMDDADLPSDRMFRNAWTLKAKKIDIPVDEAKLIAHEYRRAAREAEFAPLDSIVGKQIPGDSVKAEAERVKVRAKYDAMQTAIDASTTVAGLKAALESKT